MTTKELAKALEDRQPEPTEASVLENILAVFEEYKLLDEHFTLECEPAMYSNKEPIYFFNIRLKTLPELGFKYNIKLLEIMLKYNKVYIDVFRGIVMHIGNEVYLNNIEEVLDAVYVSYYKRILDMLIEDETNHQRALEALTKEQDNEDK